MNPLPSPPASPDLIHVFWHEGMLAHGTGTGMFDTGFNPVFLEVLDKHPVNWLSPEHGIHTPERTIRALHLMAHWKKDSDP